jgi:hypothetical protein
MNSSRSEQIAQAAQRILERLKSSGGKGLTKKVLTKEKLEEQALKELVRAGKVANLGAANSSYYVLLGDQSIDALRLSLAISAVKDLMGDGKPRLVSKAEIEKKNKLPSKARQTLLQALKQLVDERWLISLKAGRSNYFLSIASLRDYLQIPTTPPPPIQTPFDPTAARLAYQHLAEQLRSPEILISDLQEASGLPIKPLQEWLLAECRAHRAVPGKGEPTVATPRQLECALIIDREPHLYIRFLE